MANYVHKGSPVQYCPCSFGERMQGEFFFPNFFIYSFNISELIPYLNQLELYWTIFLCFSTQNHLWWLFWIKMLSLGTFDKFPPGCPGASLIVSPILGHKDGLSCIFLPQQLGKSPKCITQGSQLSEKSEICPTISEKMFLNPVVVSWKKSRDLGIWPRSLSRGWVALWEL